MRGMKDRAIVVSSGNQRIRFKIPGRRGDVLYFSKVASALEHHPEVRNIRVNPIAESLLIHLHRDHHINEVVQFAHDEQLFEIRGPLLSRPTIGESLWRHTQTWDMGLVVFSRGRLNSENIFCFAFLVLGLIQLKRGQIMQPAIPLLWRALALLRKIHEDENRS
jgi:Heavy metal associated domain 2